MNRTTQKQLKSEIIYLKDKNKKLLEQMIDICERSQEQYRLFTQWKHERSVVAESRDEYEKEMERLYILKMTDTTKGI